MITVLPGVFLLLGYAFFFAAPLSKELKDLRDEVGSKREDQPTPQEVLASSAQIRALRSEVERLSAVVEDRKTREVAMRAYWGNTDARNRGGAFVGELLTKHGIVLVEETLTSGIDQKKFESVLGRTPGSQLWKLRIAGSFLSVSGLLEGLAAIDLPVLPVAIEMDPLVDGNKSIHLWSLWIVR